MSKKFVSLLARLEMVRRSLGVRPDGYDDDRQLFDVEEEHHVIEEQRLRFCVLLKNCTTPMGFEIFGYHLGSWCAYHVFGRVASTRVERLPEATLGRAPKILICDPIPRSSEA
ncbi:Uncharacterized protein Rs2_32195 [Raphanus sativus]|nr:Uncharacterized protein Rs2_32195 [Raphanus sativus]